MFFVGKIVIFQAHSYGVAFFAAAAVVVIVASSLLVAVELLREKCMQNRYKNGCH